MLHRHEMRHCILQTCDEKERHLIPERGIGLVPEVSLEMKKPARKCSFHQRT